MSENPPLPRACARCYRRKQKCDRRSPRCTNCTEANAACELRDRDSGSSLGHGNTIQVQGYVESLQQRLDEFERQTANRRRLLSQQSISTHQSQVISPGSTNNLSNSAISPEEDRNALNTMGEIGFLSLGAMAEPSGQSHGGLPKTLSRETLVNAAVNLSGLDPSHAAPREQMWDRPSHKLDSFTSGINKLSQVSTKEYFEYAIEETACCLPYLNRVQLLEYYQEVLLELQGSNTSDSLTPPAFRVFIVYVLISIGICTSSTAIHLHSVAHELHLNAMKLFSEIALEEPDSAIIYCMLLLVIYSIRSPRGGSTWQLIGLAMKQCITLQMHREPESTESSIEQHRRRWLFWAIYSIERTVSSCMDRPYCIQDLDITLHIPTIDTTSEPGQLDWDEEKSYQFISHSRLMSAIHTRRNDGIVFHWANYDQWKRDLIINQQRLQTPIHQRPFLSQLSWRVMSQLVMEVMREDQTTNGRLVGPTNLREELMTGCVSFVRQMADKIENESYVASSLDAYDIFGAGSSYLCLSLSLESSRLPKMLGSSTETVRRCTTILTLTGERFPIFKKVVIILWSLLDYTLQRQTTPNLVHSIPASLSKIPSIVPRYLRTMISEALKSPRV